MDKRATKFIPLQSQHGYTTVKILFAALAALGVFWSREALRAEVAHVEIQDRAPLYLPNEQYVRLATMGFDNFASDLLWFNTINYFGKQLRGNRDYQWLSNMCNLVTSLDPRKSHVYEFCANMLAWEAKDFTKSIEILDRAVAAEPNTWRFLYIRGFNYWYFFQDTDKAVADLQAAANMKDAPPFLASLVSRLFIHKDSPETAVTFLQNAVRNASDESAKKVLLDRLKRAILARDLKVLQDQIDRFAQQKGAPAKNLHDLVEAGLLRFVPEEPFGGKYELDPSSGKAISTSGEEPLKFYGKTKDTGIFGMENAGAGQ